MPQPVDREAGLGADQDRGALTRAGNGEDQLGPNGDGKRAGADRGPEGHGVPDAPAPLQSRLCEEAKEMRRAINEC